MLQLFPDTEYILTEFDNLEFCPDKKWFVRPDIGQFLSGLVHLSIPGYSSGECKF